MVSKHRSHIFDFPAPGQTGQLLSEPSQSVYYFPGFSVLRECREGRQLKGREQDGGEVGIIYTCVKINQTLKKQASKQTKNSQNCMPKRSQYGGIILKTKMKRLKNSVPQLH